MANPTQEQIEKWHNDPANWIGGMIYYNKQDARVLVDKSPKWAGITFNFANPKSYLVFLGAICFFAFVIYVIDNKGF